MSGIISQLQIKDPRVKVFLAEAGPAYRSASETEFEATISYDLVDVHVDKDEQDNEDYYFCTMKMQIVCNAKGSDGVQKYHLHYESECDFRQKTEGVETEAFEKFAERSGITTLVATARANIRGATALIGFTEPYTLPMIDVNALIEARASKPKDTEQAKE